MAKRNNKLKENVVTDTEIQEREQTVIANTAFNDKYTGTKYEKGTKFIIVDEDVETEKIADKKYRVSAKRAEEIKSKGYID